MGRPGIDRKAIIATIESIAASGEEPNTMNVRRELGAGSYTTIIDVITQWKADRKAPKGAPAVVAPLPEKASALLSDMESKVLELLRPHLRPKQNLSLKGRLWMKSGRLWTPKKKKTEP